MKGGNEGSYEDRSGDFATMLLQSPANMINSSLSVAHWRLPAATGYPLVVTTVVFIRLLHSLTASISFLTEAIMAERKRGDISKFTDKRNRRSRTFFDLSGIFTVNQFRLPGVLASCEAIAGLFQNNERVEMRRLNALITLLLLLAHAVPTSASALQNATEGCSVPHRSVAAIVESAGGGDGSSSLPDPIPYRQPEGIPVDPPNADAVTATVDQMVACVNTGDVVGFLSLMSNDFMSHYFSGMGFTESELESIEPEAVPEVEMLVLLETWDMTQLSDGRIAARLVFEQGELESPELNSLLTFVSVDGAWRIDGWQPVKGENEGSDWHTVQTGTGTGSVVPLDEVEAYAAIINGSEVQGMWTPTYAEIIELEKGLSAFLASDPNATQRLIEGTADQYRHYLGFVSGSKTIILVNAFCDEANWSATEPVMVLDGGDCYFSVMYDPATQLFSNLRVNGSA